MSEVDMIPHNIVPKEEAFSLVKAIIEYQEYPQNLNSFMQYLGMPMVIDVRSACSCKQKESFRIARTRESLAPLEQLIRSGFCQHTGGTPVRMGFYPIHVAAAFGQKDLVKEIIGMTSPEMLFAETLSLKMLPFDLATVNREEETAEYILELGFSYSTHLTDQTGRSRIHRLLLESIIRGQLSCCQLIVRAGFSINRDLWKKYMEEAVGYDRLDIVQWLIDLGVAHVDEPIPDENGPTSLYKAISISMVTMLLDNGADPRVTCNGHVSVLTSHVYNNRLDICRLLLERFPDIVNFSGSADNIEHYNPTQYACWQGNEEALDLLLESGGDCYTPAVDNNTALGLACHVGSLPIVQKLLTLDCDPNVADKDGDTALIYATYNGNEAICHLLLDHGANPSHANHACVTPIWNAVYSRTTSVVIRLISLNVDLEMATRGINIFHENQGIYSDPVRPLFVAIHLEEVAIAKYLVDAGCNLNAERYMEYDFDSMIKDYEEKNKIWIDTVLVTPRTLSWWCKRVIRRRLSLYPQQAVSSLDISSQAKEYLLQV